MGMLYYTCLKPAKLPTIILGVTAAAASLQTPTTAAAGLSLLFDLVMVGFKNRYLVMEVLLDPNKDHPDREPVVITQLNLANAIKESILMNFGECGLASSLNSFQVKYVNPITKLCIIRTSREDHQRVWAATTMVRSIGNCSATINLLDLSGNIKACKSAALKCDELKFEQFKLTPRIQITDAVQQNMQNCLEKIKTLES